MDKRFEIRRKELIEDALIKPAVYEDLISRLAILWGLLRNRGVVSAIHIGPRTLT
jgi:hypothetical protein